MAKTLLKMICILLALLLPCFSFSRAEDTPLEKRMGAISHDFKEIQKQIADPAQKDSTLALIVKVKANAMASGTLQPSMIKNVPEPDRAKFLTDFKSAIDELVLQIGSLEKAVQEGNIPEAQTALKDIQETKKEGHSSFTQKKKRGMGGHDEHGSQPAPGENRSHEEHAD